MHRCSLSLQPKNSLERTLLAGGHGVVNRHSHKH
jgi:hypothetical protein